MTISRRSAIKGIAALGAVTGTASCATGEIIQTVSEQSELNLPNEPDALLLNHPRAVEEMEKAGIDLLLCADPVNIYYLTNQQPIASKIGIDGLTFAALSASTKKKPVYIGNQISYYFDAPPESVTQSIEQKFYAAPADFEQFLQLESAEDLVAAPATQGFVLRQHTSHPETLLESSRRKQVETAVSEINASIDAAILSQILSADLPNKTIAIDNESLRRVISRSGLDVKVVDGERLLRRIRLQKSATEIKMMRYVAQANSRAALKAAKTVREGANFRELRAEFAKECGQYMCNAKYMMLDTHTPTLADGKIENGRSFLIDCVSEFQGYHGDYGRTVCIGEPNRKMKRIIDTLSNVWDRILPELQPGLSYPDLHTLSARLFAESKVDAGFAINPHSVGLHHSDDPALMDFSPAFIKENVVLQEGMVLSVDMPVLDLGQGGTAHLEDLVLIGKDGPELLNDTGNRFIVV